MNVFRLSIRNMMSRPLQTTLSLILLSFGVGMISLLLQLNQQVQEQLENNVRGIDMVVGAKGSPMQLILSSVYHIDNPTGNILLSEVKKLRKNRMIAQSIPLSYGDSYGGHRIIGTTHEYATLYEANIEKGRLWQKPFEVSLGAAVAESLNLTIGDTFMGQHGLVKGGESHDSHAYKVVGVFNYTNAVLDQLILTSTESVWEVHHHVHKSSEETYANGEVLEANEEITALLVKFRSPIGIIQLPRMINEKTNMQAAVPAYEVSRLYNLLGVGIDTLRLVAFLIILLSALSVFFSLLHALKEREYELALLRTYGARPMQLFWSVLQEGLFLSLLGYALGLLLSRMGLLLISFLVREDYHYHLSGAWFIKEELILLAVTLLIGLVASFIPSIRVFRLNISKILSDA